MTVCITPVLPIAHTPAYLLTIRAPGGERNSLLLFVILENDCKADSVTVYDGKHYTFVHICLVPEDRCAPASAMVFPKSDLMSAIRCTAFNGSTPQISKGPRDLGYALNCNRECPLFT